MRNFVLLFAFTSAMGLSQTRAVVPRDVSGPDQSAGNGSQTAANPRPAPGPTAIIGMVPMLYLDPGVMAGNALQYAFGETISDGALHPVASVAAGSLFYGKTTLAQLAAMTTGNGMHPFAFLVDAGGLTGPLCTVGSSVNCFTSPAGYYRLSDAMVANGTIDVGWLALQAALVQRTLVLPPGTYTVNLPLLIPMGTQGSSSTMIAGMGMHNSVIVPNSNFGADRGALMCGDPAASTSNMLGQYSPNGAGCWGVGRDFGVINSSGNFATANVNGAAGLMDGISQGARFSLQSVYVQGFANGIGKTGDHTTSWNVITNLNYNGIRYRYPNATLVGNDHWIDLQSTDYLANISVAPGATLSALIDGQSYLGSAIPVLGEAATATNGPNGSNGCTPVIAGATLNVMMENIGYGIVVDQTGMPGFGSNGSSYVDSAKCRALFNFQNPGGFHRINTGNDAALAAAHPNWKRRAMFDVSIIDFGFSMTNVQDGGGGLAPNAGGLLDAPVALINVNGLGSSSATGAFFSGDLRTMWNQLNQTPMINANVLNDQGTSIRWEIPGQMSGIVGRLYLPKGYVPMVGDGIEESSLPYMTPLGNHPYGLSTAILGTLQQAIVTGGSYVPVATAGNLTYNAGSSMYSTAGAVYANEGNAVTTVAGGSGYRNGTYTILGVGGGCTVPPVINVTVSGGVFAQPTQTVAGFCSAAATFAIPSSAGAGAGALIAGRFPSGQATMAASTGPLLGTNYTQNSNGQGLTLRVQQAGPVPYATSASANGMQIPALKASSGTRFLCIDATGVITSSATACSGN